MTIAAQVSTLLGMEVETTTRLHGGDLSAVYRLTLADGRMVAVKAGPLVAIEAEMLRAIGASGAPAPHVIACEDGLLVMEWLEAAGSLAPAWDSLAEALGILHARKGEAYGWPHDYAFGDVAIINTATRDWPQFWAERRLLCHLPFLPAPLARRIEQLAQALPERLPRTPPASLLHGDLWSGNVLVSGSTVAGLIDPACYHGDHEVDFAMLTLFDHPPQRFFDAAGLEPGWQERQPVYQLWPWLVHLRLFGSGYRSAVETCLAELGV